MARRSLRHRAMGGETLLGSMIFEFFSPGIAQVHKLAGCEYLRNARLDRVEVQLFAQRPTVLAFLICQYLKQRQVETPHDTRRSAASGGFVHRCGG